MNYSCLLFRFLISEMNRSPVLSTPYIMLSLENKDWNTISGIIVHIK